MGRHGSRRRGTVHVGRVRIPLTAVALCVLVLAIAGLSAWWWAKRSVTDPIDAAPVSATATVVASPSCLDDGTTTVRVSGVDPTVESVLDGCGFAAGQRISVEYRAGHPDVVRLAGTTRAGHSSPVGTFVPIVILLAGLAAAAGLVALGRSGSKRSRAGAVSVAELRARIGATKRPAPPDAGQPPPDTGQSPSSDIRRPPSSDTR